ncbi:MAG: ABC transporter permease, partial [Chloroflexi bacterium]|nr:ABC transporter permease [Chloroflexota bacterium]
MSADVGTKTSHGLAGLWHRPEIRDGILDNLIWLILAVTLLAFSFIPRYFTVPVLTNVLLHSTFLSIMVIGETLCLITGNFDLSVESVLAFCAMFAAVLMGTRPPTPGWGISPWIVLPSMLAVGGLIGAINGFCVSRLKINPFIVTLATMIVFRGLTVIFTMSQAVIKFPLVYKAIGTMMAGPIPVLVLLALALYLFFHFLITRTLFGRRLFATGGNAPVAFAFGLEPDRV